MQIKLEIHYAPSTDVGGVPFWRNLQTSELSCPRMKQSYTHTICPLTTTLACAKDSTYLLHLFKASLLLLHVLPYKLLQRVPQLREGSNWPVKRWHIKLMDCLGVSTGEGAWWLERGREGGEREKGGRNGEEGGWEERREEFIIDTGGKTVCTLT